MFHKASPGMLCLFTFRIGKKLLHCKCLPETSAGNNCPPELAEINVSQLPSYLCRCVSCVDQVNGLKKSVVLASRLYGNVWQQKIQKYLQG